ncbi:MAG: coniferyl-alcohol dehydrogenase [Gordonia paraffinivorans]
MSDLTDHTFVVTGTASGIGQAVARRLLAAGAQVHGLDRKPPTADLTSHTEVDLADPSSIDAAVAALPVGDIDGLINVAGIPGTAPGDQVFAVNALAVRHLTGALVGRIRRGGSVVVVSSIAGAMWPARLEQIRAVLATASFADGARWFAENPQEGNAYTFSKEVATVYALSMAVPLVEHGIRINAVMPGPVETPILPDFEASMGKDVLDGVRALLGRHAQPEDIADAVVLCVGDEARWVNGNALVVDGGLTGGVLSGVVPAPEI